MAILVVDDEPNFARILEAKLRKSSYDVRTADHAAAALAALLQEPFDLVLLDLRLPDGDALNALPLLRSSAPNTAFIAMTAYEDVGVRQRALAAGAADVLFKPFDLNELVRNIGQRIADAQRAQVPSSGTSFTPERRRSVRYPCAARVLITTSANPAAIEGVTVDVSEGGFLVCSASALAPGDTCRVDLTGLRSVTSRLEASAEVLRSQQLGSLGSTEAHRMAARFTSLKTAEAAQLSRAIATMAGR